MDLSQIVSNVQNALGPVLWFFTLFAVGDDALDLFLYVRTAKAKITAQALLAVFVQDVGTRAFASVFAVGLVAAIAAGSDPLHAGLGAAALAAGASTILLKNDFQAKLAKAFPDFVNALVRPS